MSLHYMEMEKRLSLSKKQVRVASLLYREEAGLFSIHGRVCLSSLGGRERLSQEGAPLSCTGGRQAPSNHRGEHVSHLYIEREIEREGERESERER